MSPDSPTFSWTDVAADRESGVVRLPSWIAPPTPAPAEVIVLEPPSDAATEPPVEDAALEIAADGDAAGTERPRSRAPAPPSTAPRSSRAPGSELAFENAQLRAQIATLALALVRLRHDLVEATTPELVHLACVVAERAVGRAFEADHSLIGAWVREAIAELPERDEVTVTISADLAGALPEDLDPDARVVVDASLARATCEVRAGASSVDVSAASRVGAIADHLVAGER